MVETASKTSGLKYSSSESINSLTKPALYGLYDEDVIKSEDTEIYEEVQKTSRTKELASESKRSGTDSVTRLAFLFAWFVLSIAGIAYHELSKNLHDNHDLHTDFASRPLLLGAKIAESLSFGYIPQWVFYAVEGILFGSIVPLVDWLTNRYDNNTITLTSVLRSVNAMLGVAFGIRRIEWSSSLQASVSWFLLNVILWLFFDGTLTTLVVGLGIGLTTCATCYNDITDNAQLLYFIDFYFLGLLLFSRLGKYLYRHR